MKLNHSSPHVVCLVVLHAITTIACGKTAEVADAAVEADAAIEAGIDADLGGEAAIITEAVLYGIAGTRAGGIDIFSSLPSGVVLASGVTDPDGRATIRVLPGGSVTAIYKHTKDTGVDLVTWVGVKPGDTLIFGQRVFENLEMPLTRDRVPLGAQTYSWPLLAGATAYMAFTSCGSEWTPGTATKTGEVKESSHCHREPMDVLFVAYNDSALIGYAMRTDVAFQSGNDVAISDWIAPGNATVNIAGLPSAVQRIEGRFYTAGDGIRFREFREQNNYFESPTDGILSATFPWPGFGDRIVGQVALDRAGLLGTTLILDLISPTTLTQTVMSPSLPPGLQGLTSSVPRRKVEWYLVPEEPTGHDGITVKLQWYRGQDRSFWSFIMPPGQTSVDLPGLPPALGNLGPMQSDQFGIVDIQVFEVPSLSSYDMVRTQPARNILCLQCAIRAGHFQHATVATLDPGP